MKEAYVIFGFEWTTNERGAAPEISEYRVVKVIYSDKDWLEVGINTHYLDWLREAKERVWARIIHEYTARSYEKLSALIKDFEESCETCWYFLDQIEYNEWVSWAEDSDDIVVETYYLSE